MPTGKIGILISVANLMLKPSTQDRDTVTSFLESNVLPLGYIIRVAMTTFLNNVFSKYGFAVVSISI